MTRHRSRWAFAITGAVCLIVATVPSAAGQDFPPRSATPFEVWALDQSDTHAEGGGNLYIYTGLRSGDVHPVPEVIDLAVAATDAGFPIAKRPHILGFNVEATHGIISNVASGDVQIIDVATRTIVGNLGGLGQLHMAGPSPDSTQIGAVAIAEGRVIIISTDYASNTYAVEHEVELSIAANASGTLEDQLGYLDPHPICSNYTPDSQFLFVNFTGGGMAIFNVGDITMPPVLEEVYSAAEAPGVGCGLIQHPDGRRMYTNSGSKALGDAENVYVWNMQTLGNGVKDDLLRTIPLLSPAQSAVQRGDAHGPMFAAGQRFLWVAMRMDNTMKVIDTRTDRLVNTFSLATAAVPNPTHDVIDTNPQRNRMFVAMRGFCPLTAIPEFVDETAQDCPGDQATQIASPGRSPGLGVVTVSPTGRTGQLTQVLPISNVTATGLDITDPHGIKTVVLGR